MPIRIPDSARIRGLIRQAPDAVPVKAADGLAESMGTSSAAAKSGRKVLGGGDSSLSYSHARQLALSPDPGDRFLLQDMFESLSDNQKRSFLDSLTLEARDPKSPASAPRLSEEGQIIEAVVEGRKPNLPPERVAAIRAAAGDGGMADVEPLPDLKDKSAPTRPMSQKSMKEKGLKVPDDKERLRSTAKVKRGKDGLPSIKHTDVSLDRPTAAQARNAGAKFDPKKGKFVETGQPARKVEEISDNAARAGDTSPEETYTNRLRRTLGGRDPRGVRDSGPSAKPKKQAVDEFGEPITGRDKFSEADALTPDDDARIFTRKPQGSSFNAVNDFGDIRYLLDQIGVTGVPNARFDSPQDAARALISGAPQEMFDATPITASERARFADQMLPEGASPAGMPAELAPTSADLKYDLQTLEPDLATRLTQKGRATRSVQQQAIDALAAKLDEFYGSEGWGDSYRGPDVASDLPAKSTRPPERPLDLESHASRSTEDELKAFRRARKSYDLDGIPDISDAPPAQKLPDPVGARLEPAGDLTGTTDAIAADRTAKRQDVINRIKDGYPGENFTTRRTKDIQADIDALGVDADPAELNALQRELRAAKFIDFHLSVPDRMAGKGDKGLLKSSKGVGDKAKRVRTPAPSRTVPGEATPGPYDGTGPVENFDSLADKFKDVEGFPETRSMDLDGNPLDSRSKSAEAPESKEAFEYEPDDGEWLDEATGLVHKIDDADAGKSVDSADAGKTADSVDSTKNVDGDAPDVPKRGVLGKTWDYTKKHPTKSALIGASAAIPTIGLIKSILNSNKEFPEGGNALPGQAGISDEEAAPPIDESAFTAAVGGGVRPTAMSPEERLRVLSQAFNSPLNKNTQTLSNWRD